ncbi:ATP-grasp domain-containing protein [Actinoplanes sp. NPDC051851]|uniref:ATP-grasp domain-containing protein n=1 Tax=Actinoplanes sp. NPDC051851 TaxID=3154753 RepID=UPI0034347C6D
MSSRISRRLDDLLLSRNSRTNATSRRRGLVMAEMLAAVLGCVVGYLLLVERARYFEVSLASHIIDLLHVDRISGVLGDSFVVFGPGMEPVIATVTGSCTILSSVLALAALALVALRQRPQALLGFVVAAVFVLAANQVRLVLSLLAGRYLAVDALIFFHDWIGAVINFAYTLFGLLIMIGLTMYDAQRAEQDRSGRHTADRPAAWAKPGLGHRAPLSPDTTASDATTPGTTTPDAKPSQIQVTSFMYRRVLPKALARRLAKRREQRRVDYRVGHENAARRAAIVRELAGKGLSVHTATLLAVASYETDPQVLDALAEAVAERQWEPLGSAEVTALRLWARAWLMRAPAGDTGSAGDAGSPVGAAGSPVGAAGSVGTAASPMGAVTPTGRLIAVTGAGGPAGVAVIRALQAAGEQVLALDANPDGAGLRLAARSAVLPRADRPGYAEALRAILAEHRPDALVCTVAEEYGALRAAGTATPVWLPEHPEICLDKITFATTLHAAGVPHPATAWTLETAYRIPGPWVVKPAHGRGSRDVVLVDDPADLAHAFATVPEPIAQTRLGGREFTADALVDRDGTMVACVPRWREETRGGISVQGTTFASLAVTEVVAATLRAVRHTGPANVQGFVDEHGEVTVVEVNPRFSGGLPLTLAAGANVVNAYVKGILNPGEALPAMGFRAGLRMTRHFDEIFYEVPDISEIPAGVTAAPELELAR